MGSIPAPAGEPRRATGKSTCCTVHPRACGGAGDLFHLVVWAPGPSPRLRGSPHLAQAIEDFRGSIPAPAGEPAIRHGARSARKVHPRACGGARGSRGCGAPGSGPSPRLRGSQGRRVHGGVLHGSIPAPAGEPTLSHRSVSVIPVHPRACGGAGSVSHSTMSAYGPSPRLRGSRRAGAVAPRPQGSIPAPAGEPELSAVNHARQKVHPRACGGAECTCPSNCSHIGPSPRLRGSRGRPMGGVMTTRSIPAPAGEPPSVRPMTSSRWVHPRACGGADASAFAVSGVTGPSPRLRGSPPVDVQRLAIGGSIPAPAGEPTMWRIRRPRSAVHPRACGGAFGGVLEGRVLYGPSPRLRGSRPFRGIWHLSTRSIPAPAGEPGGRPAPRTSTPVHPRACGGARTASSAKPMIAGPSPRLRGSLERGRRSGAIAGSIPAPAGEPGSDLPADREQRVHPRACGGAWIRGDLRPVRLGPSPRLRGSRPGDGRVGCAEGSIPAPAGEPAIRATAWSRPGVHPRACGGARSRPGRVQGSSGPSPRLRGSLRSARLLLAIVGSIPAPAGEPPREGDGQDRQQVHPRACGGARSTSTSLTGNGGPSPRLRGSPHLAQAIEDFRGSIPAPAGEPISAVSPRR